MLPIPMPTAYADQWMVLAHLSHLVFLPSSSGQAFHKIEFPVIHSLVTVPAWMYMKATLIIVLCYHDSVRYSGYMFGAFHLAKFNRSIYLPLVSCSLLSFALSSTVSFVPVTMSAIRDTTTAINARIARSTFGRVFRLQGCGHVSSSRVEMEETTHCL
jgi:hypothetical protein